MYAHEIIEFYPTSGTWPIETMKINSSSEEISVLLKAIETESESFKPDFKLLKEKSFELIRRLPLPVQNFQDTFILRSRENLKGELFQSSSQLNYNLFPEKITSGRFNLKGEAAFYGALPITSHNASGQLTSMIEACKELFDSNSKFEEKYFTVGKWNIVKPIKTVILTFYKDAEQKSMHLKNLNPGYLKFISSACSDQDLKKCTNFYSLFSEFAGKKYDSESKYLISTAFLHALKQFYGNELAILYSSSMTENTGLNIVLTKQILDTNHLHFEGAIMFKTVRDRSNLKCYNIYPCTNYALANDAGNFSYKYVL